jgi:hypothetical protein
MMNSKTKYRMKVLFPMAVMAVLLGYVTHSLIGMAARTRMTAFVGGKFEASGVVYAPGTDGVLFVDDGRTGEVFWMRLDENGNQAGAIKSVPLGITVIDMEGITTDGAWFYTVGSQSKPRGNELGGLVRFKFNGERGQAEGVEAISGLKQLLADNVSDLNGWGDRSLKDGGINIEGLAWDPQESRFLLGLRSPLIDDQAIVIPLKLRDPKGPFTAANLSVPGGRAILLPLGGAGIRSMEYDDQRKAIQILSGATNKKDKVDFKRWEWNGKSGAGSLRDVETFDESLKPEGITRVVSGKRNFSFIVCDTSGYTSTK